MSTATAARTRKPRNTAASLIASEFTARQQNPLKKNSKQEVALSKPAFAKSSVLSEASLWDEIVLPAPIESHPVKEKQAASPVILVLIAFVVVTVLVKVSIALILIAAKITKKIAQQVAVFWSAQMGERKVDFRVYQAIFD